jgi:hypothetical protein
LRRDVARQRLFLYVSRETHDDEWGSARVIVYRTGAGGLERVDDQPLGSIGPGYSVGQTAVGGRFLYAIDFLGNVIRGFEVDPASDALIVIPGSPYSTVGTPMAFTVSGAAGE